MTNHCQLRRPFFLSRQIAWAATLATACCLLASLAHTQPAARAVYRCKAQGLTTFSDTPCAANAQVYEADTSRVSSFEPVETPVSRRAAAPKKVARARQDGSIAAAQARHAAECERVNDALREIESKMRAGYSVQEGERLKERQSKLDKKRKAARC